MPAQIEAFLDLNIVRTFLNDGGLMVAGVTGSTANDATAGITVVFPDGFRSAAQVAKIDKDWDLAAVAPYMYFRWKKWL